MPRDLSDANARDEAFVAHLDELVAESTSGTPEHLAAPYGRCDVCGDPLDQRAGRLCLACELEEEAP